MVISDDVKSTRTLKMGDHSSKQMFILDTPTHKLSSVLFRQDFQVYLIADIIRPFICR